MARVLIRGTPELRGEKRELTISIPRLQYAMQIERRRFFGAALTGLVLFACRIAQPPPAQAAPGRPRIGLNLAQNAYYAKEVMFKDVFKHSQPFLAQKEGANWGQSDPGGVTFGPDGYPTSMAADHSVVSLWSAPKGYPRGPMVLTWEGEGVVTAMWVDKVATTGPNRVTFELKGPIQESADLHLKVSRTNPSKPVRNIRVLPLSLEAAFAKGEPANPFRDEFTKRWTAFEAFRYMDWGSTNNLGVSSWSDRSKINDQTQGKNGVAVEYQIAHANITQTHPWFCIPHLATDDYVRRFATLVRDSLKPNLVARIEYSNEVWNGMFEQAQYAQRQATTLPGEKADFAGALRWYSKRSVEIFKIVEQVFTNNGTNPEGRKRIVRVLGSQAVNVWASQQILEYRDAYKYADALAIAPYFGWMPDAEEGKQWRTANWEQRMVKVREILKETYGHMDSHVALLRDTTKGGAKPYAHIKLFAYEGGQHFLGHPATHQDEMFTQSFIELSRRPEMKDLYFEYLKHWHEAGGADFMLFNSLSPGSKYGSWGLMEYEGEPTPPKLQGVLQYLEWAKKQPDQTLR